ncbi:hypothetical protein GP486_004867 [Trichoglossum hirsutum]|uniref:BZIP transcription factor n=1 Tax=Trichoglossum hirsutum TaxID=265104 RepID=A0A9P8LAI7_9PEZI|nr:hypothetical protein GP486_004867 [Trichoglossum hirsutum]
MSTGSNTRGAPAADDPSLMKTGAKRRREPGTSTRGVANLTPEQLEVRSCGRGAKEPSAGRDWVWKLTHRHNYQRKRANDRDAQRAIRERTKTQIETLERQIQDLTSQKPYQELQHALREKKRVQAENEDIRRRLQSIISIIQPILQSRDANTNDLAISNPTKSSSTSDDSPQFDDSGQGRHPLHPSSEHFTSKALLDRESSASDIPDKAGHSTETSLSPASTSSSRRTGNYPGIETSIPHHGRYSPMSFVDQSRENTRHGLDLRASAEKLGLSFLLDRPQSDTNVPDGHSKLSSSLGHLDSPDIHECSLPRSSSSISNMRIETYPSGSGHYLNSPGAIAHMCPTRNIPPSCPLDSILLEFLSSRQQLVAQGVPNAVVVGPPYPSVSSLLNPEKKSEAHPLTRVFADILGSFEMLSKLPEQVAVLYVMFLVMRWQISPTQENYDRVPDWITPRPSQLLTMHPIWVDYLPWPKMRDVLVRDYANYMFQDFSFHYTNTLSLNWQYEPTDVLLPTPGSDELCINPVFERHLRDLNNWSLGPEFRNAFPALCSGVRIKPVDNGRLRL